VQERGGDFRRGPAVRLGERGRLEGVFELGHGLPVVLGPAALGEQRLDPIQDLPRGHRPCPSHQSRANPKDSVIPAPPGAAAITHPGCGSAYTMGFSGCLA